VPAENNVCEGMLSHMDSEVTTFFKIQLPEQWFGCRCQFCGLCDTQIEPPPQFFPMGFVKDDM